MCVKLSLRSFVKLKLSVDVRLHNVHNERVASSMKISKRYTNAMTGWRQDVSRTSSTHTNTLCWPAFRESVTSSAPTHCFCGCRCSGCRNGSATMCCGVWSERIQPLLSGPRSGRAINRLGQVFPQWPRSIERYPSVMSSCLVKEVSPAVPAGMPAPRGQGVDCHLPLLFGGTWAGECPL